MTASVTTNIPSSVFKKPSRIFFKNTRTFFPENIVTKNALRTTGLQNYILFNRTMYLACLVPLSACAPLHFTSLHFFTSLSCRQSFRNFFFTCHTCLQFLHAFTCLHFLCVYMLFKCLHFSYVSSYFLRAFIIWRELSF